MKKCLSAGAALALALALVACGGGSSSDSSTGAGAGSSASITELRFALAPIPRLDYVTARTALTISVDAQVTPGLVTVDRTGRVVPLLARSFEQPDATTYVYTLDPRATFSDGRPVTVEDVVWSLKRNLAKDAQTAANWVNVASIASQGDDTVVIKLKTPDVSFVNIPVLATIIEKAAALKGGVDKIGTPSNLPIGAGPYRFVSFTPDVDIRLARNDHWMGARPAAERVTFKLIRDPSAISLALRSGDVDGSPFPDSRRGVEAPGIRVYEAPGGVQAALSMNTIAAPFDDVHVRRAISYALDREGILQAGLNGDGMIDETLTPLAVYGGVAPAADVEAAFASLPRYDYDVEAARAELAKSRYPDGFSTTLPVIGGTDSIVAQVITDDLAKIGIKVDVNEMPAAQWLQVLYGPRDRIALMLPTYASAYADPNAQMTNYLDPAAAAVNGLNSANYRSAEVGRLLVAQRQETDGAKRLALITQAFRAMKEDAAYAPLYSPDIFMALSKKYVTSAFTTWSFLTPWTVDIRAAA